MDKELKQYLEKMATKDDLDEIRQDMATKDDIKKLDKKIDNVHDDLIGCLEHLDSNLQEHRHDTEVHKKAAL